MAKNIEMVKDGKIYRFTKSARATHWIYVGSYAILLLTGLLLFADIFDFLAPVFGGFEGAQLIHRIVAVVFILPAFIFMLFDPKSFFGWIKECFTWTKDDFKFFPGFVKELFGMHAETPPQGFINGGEKVNSLLTILFTTLIIASGFIIWFPEFFSVAIVQWGYVIHSASMALLSAVAMVHIYLGTSLWKEALEGMLTGYTDAEFVKGHHVKWYNEVMEAEKKGEKKSS